MTVKRAKSGWCAWADGSADRGIAEASAAPRRAVEIIAGAFPRGRRERAAARVNAPDWSRRKASMRTHVCRVGYLS
jgi:hypothetical protein